MKVLGKLCAVTSEQLIRIACILGLSALPLMVVSVAVPTVWPVLGALSIGQAIGTLSFVLFLVAVARDLDIRGRLRGPRSASLAERRRSCTDDRSPD